MWRCEYEPPGKANDRTSSASAALARIERIAIDWRMLAICTNCADKDDWDVWKECMG